jgi:hypothetical protein
LNAPWLRQFRRIRLPPGESITRRGKASRTRDGGVRIRFCAASRRNLLSEYDLAA